MKIIITAAGNGSRFKNQGIKKEKYQIIANEKTLFYWSLISLKNFFEYEFIFIFQKENYEEEFVLSSAHQRALSDSVLCVDPCLCVLRSAEYVPGIIRDDERKCGIRYSEPVSI